MGDALGFLLLWNYTCSDRNMALGPLVLAELTTLPCKQMVNAKFFFILYKIWDLHHEDGRSQETVGPYSQREH